MTLGLPELFSGPKVAILGNFIDAMGLGIIVPFLPFFTETFESDPDKSNLWVGGILAGQNLGVLLGAYIVGTLADKFGAKFALALTLAGDAVFFLAAAFADTGVSFLLLRIAAGISSPGTASDTWLVKSTTPENRPQALGLLVAGSWAGVLLGGGASIAIGDKGIDVACYVSSAMAAVMFFIVLLAKEPSVVENENDNKVEFKMSESEAVKSVVFTRPFLMLSFALSAAGFAMGSNPALITIILNEFFGFSERQVASYMFVVTVTSIFCIVGAFRRLLGFLGPYRCYIVFVLIASLMYATQALGLAYIDNEFGFMVPRAVCILAEAFALPTLFYIVTCMGDVFEDKHPGFPSITGRLMGTARTVFSVGLIIGPATAVIFYNIKFYIPFAATGVVNVVVVLCWVTFQVRKSFNDAAKVKALKQDKKEKEVAVEESVGLEESVQTY
mmetsp:Transcript_8878/g.10629  ORF Transcript_8878/g.10629 Transcript_8878/m.10629 type:complete len:444 (+) Transcript_8878:149-1480(+)